MKSKILCKCGNQCAYYGAIGGYSVACKKCNRHKADLAKQSRAKCKFKNKTNQPTDYKLAESVGLKLEAWNEIKNLDIGKLSAMANLMGARLCVKLVPNTKKH